MLPIAGKKGGHKGRVRQYTSPEEIDAQLQAEKQKARVSMCLPRPPQGTGVSQDGGEGGESWELQMWAPHRQRWSEASE